MAEVEQIDFTPEFSEDEAREYAQEVVESVATDKNFDHVARAKYVKRPSLFLRYIPGLTDYAIGAEDTTIKYNEEYVDRGDIREALDEKLEESRHEFNSWKALREKVLE